MHKWNLILYTRLSQIQCILTIYFPDIELLVAHLMQRCTEGAVKLIFEQLQKSLGGSEEFVQYFPYEKALWLYGKEFLKKLQLRYVAPDEVTLTPKLLSK